jgi:hypothetical protein
LFVYSFISSLSLSQSQYPSQLHKGGPKRGLHCADKERGVRRFDDDDKYERKNKGDGWEEEKEGKRSEGRYVFFN